MMAGNVDESIIASDASTVKAKAMEANSTEAERRTELLLDTVT